MRQIWKYSLDHMEGTLDIPTGVEFLSVQAQEVPPALHERHSNWKPFLWALINPSRPKTKYAYKLIGTGWDIEKGSLDNFKFVGTVQLPDETIGLLVFHLFIEVK